MSKETLKLALEAAYLAGWSASGEGYNAEYPFGDHAKNPEEDAVWIKDRDNALREALAEQPEQESYFKFRECEDSQPEQPAQQEQEPRNIRERWNIEFDGDDLLVCFNDHEKSEGCRYERYVPATTTPPQRTWFGLTDEEAVQTWEGVIKYAPGDVRIKDFARAIEAKLKEKNT